jgi:ketol-acid reductoisomerase
MKESIAPNLTAGKIPRVRAQDFKHPLRADRSAAEVDVGMVAPKRTGNHR